MMMKVVMKVVDEGGEWLILSCLSWGVLMMKEGWMDIFECRVASTTEKLIADLQQHCFCGVWANFW